MVELEANAIQQIDYQCVDGAKNRLNLIDRSSNVAIVCIPALGVRASNYDKLVSALAQTTGLSVASFDLRGNGASSVRASRSVDFGYQELLEMELPAAISALRSHTNAKSAILFGHSLGGQLAVLAQALPLADIRGIILSASCSVYYKGWSVPGRYLLLLMTQLAAFISYLKGYFPGKKLGFAGTEAKSVMIDWARNARTGRYKLKGSKREFKRELALVNLPVLAINYRDDRFAPTAATQILCDLLGASEAQFIRVTAADLSLSRADHFSWLKRPKVVAGLIQNWLKEKQLNR